MSAGTEAGGNRGASGQREEKDGEDAPSHPLNCMRLGRLSCFDDGKAVARGAFATASGERRTDRATPLRLRIQHRIQRARSELAGMDARKEDFQVDPLVLVGGLRGPRSVRVIDDGERLAHAIRGVRAGRVENPAEVKAGVARGEGPGRDGPSALFDESARASDRSPRRCRRSRSMSRDGIRRRRTSGPDLERRRPRARSTSSRSDRCRGASTSGPGARGCAPTRAA